MLVFHYINVVGCLWECVIVSAILRVDVLFCNDFGSMDFVNDYNEFLFPPS